MQINQLLGQTGQFDSSKASFRYGKTDRRIGLSTPVATHKHHNSVLLTPNKQTKRVNKKLHELMTSSKSQQQIHDRPQSPTPKFKLNEIKRPSYIRKLLGQTFQAEQTDLQSIRLFKSAPKTAKFIDLKTMNCWSKMFNPEITLREEFLQSSSQLSKKAEIIRKVKAQRLTPEVQIIKNSEFQRTTLYVNNFCKMKYKRTHNFNPVATAICNRDQMLGQGCLEPWEKSPQIEEEQFYM